LSSSLPVCSNRRIGSGRFASRIRRC
jgi:hypothetical protein